MTRPQLLEDLRLRTQEVIRQAEEWTSLSDEDLNRKPNEEAWSALECLEHLNRYFNFYLPEFDARLNLKKTGDDTFKSSWLGEYFAQSMLPKEKLNTMKTFKSMNPKGSALSRNAIERFLKNNAELLDQLNRAQEVDLRKTKCSISISKWIKLRLGDAFRVVIYHNQRHMAQAQRAITSR